MATPRLPEPVRRGVPIPLKKVEFPAADLARHPKDALARLGQNIREKGQIQDILVEEMDDDTFLGIAGAGRSRAALLEGIDELRGTVYKGLSGNDRLILGSSDNIHRTDLKSFLRYGIVANLLANNPGWQMRDAAAALNIDPATVTRLMSANKLVPEAMAAFEADRLTLADVYALSKLSADRQPGLLNVRLGGGKHEELERAAKARRSSGEAAVRAAAVTCRLSTGVTLVAKGKALTLDDLIDCFADAQREAKRARDQNLDVKTFQAVLRDRAKAAK